MDSHYTTTVPSSFQSMVESEMQSGERIVWMDQPIGARLARSAWPIVLFGLPWTAFAVFWMWGATWGTSQTESAGPFKFFPLFGLPFVLIGVGMLSSPYWLLRGAKRSVYVLTDRRAILFRANWRGSLNIRSFNPDQLTTIQRTQHKDGTGDVVFSQDFRRDNDGHRVSSNIGFLAIRDVKSVEEMVIALAKKRVD